MVFKCFILAKILASLLNEMTIQRESYTTSDCQSRDVSPGPMTPNSWSLAHITQDPL